MIQLTDELWIGTSKDEREGDPNTLSIGAVLNVAQDLECSRYWWREKVEYAQVGLIDGPGNTLAVYCATVLCLRGLVDRWDRVMVCCHDGGRSLAVCMMYLNLTAGQYRPDPLAWSRWLTWDERMEVLRRALPNTELPTPHEAHQAAFGRIPYGILEVLL